MKRQQNVTEEKKEKRIQRNRRENRGENRTEQNRTQKRGAKRNWNGPEERREEAMFGRDKRMNL
jgi:hypothetical protein